MLKISNLQAAFFTGVILAIFVTKFLLFLAYLYPSLFILVSKLLLRIDNSMLWIQNNRF